MMHNPVFESSMKRRMRSWRAPLLIGLYIVFLLVVSYPALSTLMKDEVSLGNLRAGLETYIYLTVMQFMLIVLVAPALTAGSICGERERQTLDLLLCTRVGSLRIVLGKLLSSVCFLALMVVASLPVMALTLYYGGVGIGDIALMELFLIVVAFACCAVGILCSAIFKRTVTATVVAYLSIFAIGVGTLLLPLVLQIQQISEAVGMLSGMSYGSGVAFIGGVSGPTAVYGAASPYALLPKLFFVNPAIGLFSLLVDQTGLLSNTMSSMMGWRGSELFAAMEMIGSVAWINVIVLLVLSAGMVCVAALFVKPGGRKVRRKK